MPLKAVRTQREELFALLGLLVGLPSLRPRQSAPPLPRVTCLFDGSDPVS